MQKLGNQSGSGVRLVLPVWRQNALSFVVSREPVNTRLHQNQPEFAVLVFTVALQVLTDRDRLLDQIVKIFGQVRRQTHRLHYSQDFVARDEPYLRHTVRIPQNDTCRKQQMIRVKGINEMLEGWTSEISGKHHYRFVTESTPFCPTCKSVLWRHRGLVLTRLGRCDDREAPTGRCPFWNKQHNLNMLQPHNPIGSTFGCQHEHNVGSCINCKIAYPGACMRPMVTV